MWKKLTTSKQNLRQNEFAEKMKVDNGLMKLDPKQGATGNFVTEERIRAIMPQMEQWIDLWVSYPDKFIELIMPPETQFKLYPFQTLTLRSCIREKRLSITATRGFSKSFIAVLSKMLRCVFLPGTKDSLVATTKQQATEIGSSKVRELCQLIPILDNEIDYRKGSGTTFSKDYISIKFKNGSVLDIVSALESTRGGRRHSILVEESAKADSKAINEIVLPLLNIARRTKEGKINPNEVSQQQLYITSAGTRQSFGYDKTIEIAIASLFKPEENFCIGFDYKVPMFYGLINKDFVEDFKMSNTYDSSSFAREYGSKWTSTVEGSLFNYDKLTSLRKLKKAEWKPENADNIFYIASVDVARSSARSVVEIFKVRRGEDHFTKSLVNIFLMEGRNFLYQASRIKELDMMFGFEWVVIDSNGLGVGLVDFLMTENTHPTTGQSFPAYNVKNIKEYPDYAIDQKIGAPPKIWVLKTNQHSAGSVNCPNIPFPTYHGGRQIAC